MLVIILLLGWCVGSKNFQTYLFFLECLDLFSKIPTPFSGCRPAQFKGTFSFVFLWVALKEMHPLKERIRACLFSNEKVLILAQIKVFPNLCIHNRIGPEVRLEPCNICFPLHILLATNAEANEQESFPQDLVSC